MALKLAVEKSLKTSFGKCAFFVVVCIAIYILLPQYFFPLTILLALINLWHSRRMIVVLAGNIWFWIFSDNLSWASVDLLFPIHVDVGKTLLIRVLIVATVIGILTIGLYFKPKKPIIVFLVAYVMALYLIFGKPGSGLLFTFFGAVTIIFGNFFWYLCLAATEKNSTIGIRQIFYFHPFWTDRPAPIPQGWHALQNFGAKNEYDWVVCRSGALWTLTRIFLSYTILSCIYFFIYGIKTSFFRYLDFLPQLQIPPASMVGFQYINTLPLSIFDLWIVQFSTTCEFLLYFIITYDTIIFIARASGFALPNNTTNPFSASTFHEFLSKTMYYYNKLLVRTFFAPIYYNLTFIRNYNLRTFFAVFGAVFLFGSAYHFISLPTQLISLGFMRTFWKFTQVLPYFTVLSFLVALSVVVERSANRKHLVVPRSLRYVLPIFCFTLYSLCITMIVGHYMKSEWIDHKKFLLSLFGL